VYVRISFTRNGAVNTVTTSRIGSKRKPKYLERNPLLRLKQRIRKAGAGRLLATFVDFIIDFVKGTDSPGRTTAGRVLVRSDGALSDHG
jgi:hypothetical protein